MRFGNYSKHKKIFLTNILFYDIIRDLEKRKKEGKEVRRGGKKTYFQNAIDVMVKIC